MRSLAVTGNVSPPPQGAEWRRPPYSAVARIYDRLMRPVFTDRQRPLLDALTAHLGLTPGAWADAACGTGTVACHLASRGWRVFGADISRDMLAVAGAKATVLGVPTEFAIQDMRRLRTPFACDVVSCFFDSLNILTRSADLVRAFQAAARCLKPGGYYVFDAVTPHQVRHLWKYCDSMHEGQGFFGAWQILKHCAPNTTTVLMRWFIRDDNGMFYRADETHRVRGYSRREIAGALQQAGLRLEAAYEGDEGFLAPVARTTMRIDYIARKPL